MSTDNIGEKMERAAGNNPKDRGPFRLFKRRSFEPSGRLRPTDEVITEQAARAFPKRPEPDLPLNGAVIDFPQRPSTEPQNPVVIPDQNQPTAYQCKFRRLRPTLNYHDYHYHLKC